MVRRVLHRQRPPSSASSFVKSDFDAESLDSSPSRSRPSGGFGGPYLSLIVPDVEASKFVLKVRIEEGNNGSSRLVRIRFSEIQSEGISSSFDGLVKFISDTSPYNHTNVSIDLYYQDDDDECVKIVTTMGLLDAIEQNADKNVLRITAKLTCTVIKIATESNSNHRVGLAQLKDDSGIISFDKLTNIINLFMEYGEEDIGPSFKLLYQSEDGDIMTISSTESLMDAIGQKTANEILCITTSMGYPSDFSDPNVDAAARGPSGTERPIDAAQSINSSIDPETQEQVEATSSVSIPQEWSKLGEALTYKTAGWNCNSCVATSSDGMIIAVGSPGYNGNRGAVRVYEREGDGDGSWVQLSADIIGKINGGLCGFSVSLSADGKIMAVGSPFDSEQATRSGCVQMFEFANGEWRQRGSHICAEIKCDYLWSVSLSGDGRVVAIGASGSTNNGYARVYEYSQNTWVQRGHDIVGVSSMIQFGRTVSLSFDGATLAVGSPLYSSRNHGQVCVYSFAGGAWLSVGTIEGKQPGGEFGTSVRLSNNGRMMAVGAPGSDAGQGAAYVYMRSEGIWTQVGDDILGESNGDHCGRSVSLSSCGRILAVGSPYHSSQGKNNCGMTCTYELVESKWVRLGSDVVGESADDRCGRAVFLSSDGNTLAVGSLTSNKKEGSVSVYVM